MKFLSLFAGIGGFDLGLERAGMECVGQVEIDPKCQAVLAKHWPHVKRIGDIRNVKGDEFGTIDLICGGFPCQDISIANVTNGGGEGIKGKRSGLWKEYARLISKIKPRWIIFENSPMLIQRGFEVVVSDLYILGYDCEWRSLFASQFGFPHFRERLYGLAYPCNFRCKDNNKKGGILHQILPKSTPRQIALPSTFKRYDRNTINSSIRIDDGFPRRLDRDRIRQLGNAVVPQIPEIIGRAIMQIEAPGAIRRK